MNEEIISIIESYIRKDKTDYALMITGPWGCGKSFHWRNRVKPHIETLRVDKRNHAETEKYRVIDVSLNGVESKEEIISQILSSRFSMGKAGIITWDILREIAESSKKAKLFGIIGKQLTSGNIGSIISSSDTILCFDDLERHRMHIQSILGYINTTFVESHHYKVIFIADEGKMIDEAESQHKDYLSIKEKFIGRTLRFRLDCNSIIKDISNQIAGTDQEFTSFIDANNRLVASIINDTMNAVVPLDDNVIASGSQRVENIRTIRFAMEILYEIYRRDPSRSLFDRYRIELLVFVFMIAIEFKNGKLNADDYRDDKGIPHIEEAVMFGRIRKVSEPTPLIPPEESASQNEYLIELYKRYYGISSIDTIFIQGLYEYILTGFYDEDNISKQVDDYIGEKEEPHVQAYNLLQQSQTLEDNEFLTQVKILKRSIRENKWDIYTYPKIYQTLRQYKDLNILEMNVEELRDLIVRAIRDSIDGSKYNEMWAHTRGEFLMHRSISDELLRNLLEAVSECDKELRDRERKRNVGLLLDNLDNDHEITQELMNKLLRLPILNYIDREDLKKIIETYTNAKIQNFTQVVRGAMQYGIAGDYEGDSTAIEKCIKLLKGAIKNETQKPMRRYELSRLESSLAELKDKIDQKET